VSLPFIVIPLERYQNAGPSPSMNQTWEERAALQRVRRLILGCWIRRWDSTGMKPARSLQLIEDSSGCLLCCDAGM
jgi:hypothetical protein